MDNKNLPDFKKSEEVFNAVTHIVGGSIGIVIFIVCLVLGIINKLNAIQIISLIVYGISVILLYTMSSIYHFLRRNLAKKVFRILDHCTIFILIAGTYTPICLITLSSIPAGLILLISVWILSLLGITINAINMHSRIVKNISMFIYIFTGWCALIFIRQIIDIIEFMGFFWILLGGISYTIGTIFYSFGKKRKYFHSIWHFFVLFGTISQAVSIIFYII